MAFEVRVAFKIGLVDCRSFDTRGLACLRVELGLRSRFRYQDVAS